MGRKPAYDIPCLDSECRKSVTHAFGKGSKEKIALPDKWEVKNIYMLQTCSSSDFAFQLDNGFVFNPSGAMSLPPTPKCQDVNCWVLELK